MIKEVGVIGVETDSESEVPKAFVVKNGPLDKNDVIKFMENKGPPEMKLDGGVVFVEELPRTPLGKIIRKILREQARFAKI